MRTVRPRWQWRKELTSALSFLLSFVPLFFSFSLVRRVIPLRRILNPNGYDEAPSYRPSTECYKNYIKSLFDNACLDARGLIRFYPLRKERRFFARSIHWLDRTVRSSEIRLDSSDPPLVALEGFQSILHQFSELCANPLNGSVARVLLHNNSSTHPRLATTIMPKKTEGIDCLVRAKLLSYKRA